MVLDGWLEVDGLSLARTRVTEPIVGSDAAWGRVVGVVAETAMAVARYSQVMRAGTAPERDELQLLAVNALREVERLAAWVVIDLGLPIDREALVAEAGEYLGEVEAEDNGLTHAADAMGVLLEARLSSGTRERPVADCELERSAVEILAPLLAQAACLVWDADGA